jgi:hypothetical protein
MLEKDGECRKKCPRILQYSMKFLTEMICVLLLPRTGYAKHKTPSSHDSISSEANCGKKINLSQLWPRVVLVLFLLLSKL